jgi:hypothetical protein
MLLGGVSSAFEAVPLAVGLPVGHPADRDPTLGVDSCMPPWRSSPEVTVHYCLLRGQDADRRLFSLAGMTGRTVEVRADCLLRRHCHWPRDRQIVSLVVYFSSLTSTHADEDHSFLYRAGITGRYCARGGVGGLSR